jgi:putative aldouronate transport system permease protein
MAARPGNRRRAREGPVKRGDRSILRRAVHELSVNRQVYIMLLPVLLYYALFHYQPMYGAQIAFKSFNPVKGIWASQWIGFRHFGTFFGSYYAWRIIRNTLLLNFWHVIFAFPAPIIVALLLNEVRHQAYKRVVQTLTYLPHFISLVVVCGLIIDFLARDGVVNQIIAAGGVEPIPFMIIPEWFRFVYVGSGIWQQAGWESIIYLAALSAINPELYEAAVVDGAGRWRQTLSITLPGIAPTIIIMLIMRMGRMMNIDLEKVLLLYNPQTYETADVISTFVYRKGLLEKSFSYSTAVDLLNSAINFVMLLLFNRLSRKITRTSLW